MNRVLTVYLPTPAYQQLRIAPASLVEAARTALLTALERSKVRPLPSTSRRRSRLPTWPKGQTYRPLALTLDAANYAYLSTLAHEHYGDDLPRAAGALIAAQLAPAQVPTPSAKTTPNGQGERCASPMAQDARPSRERESPSWWKPTVTNLLTESLAKQVTARLAKAEAKERAAAEGMPTPTVAPTATPAVASPTVPQDLPLRETREAANLSMNELARLAGVSRWCVWSLETGHDKAPSSRAQLPRLLALLRGKLAEPGRVPVRRAHCAECGKPMAMTARPNGEPSYCHLRPCQRVYQRWHNKLRREQAMQERSR